MEQLLIGRGRGTLDADAFERKMYVIRRRAERWAATHPTPPAGFAIASCSSRTIIYKGMLKPDQLEAYFPDLQRAGMESALALVHSRYSTNTMPMTIVERISTAMPVAIKPWAFLLDPFHSWKIQPHMVLKMMMLAMWRVQEAKPNLPIWVSPMV